MAEVLIVGAGGHAKVIIDILRETPDWTPVGCLSPGSRDESVCGVPIVGDDKDLPLWLEKGVCGAFVALGDNALRAKLCRRVTSSGFHLINAISRRAIISPSVALGKGIAVMPGAIINAESIIGDCCIINTGATVDHDCHIGAACHVAPGSHVAGRVTLGEGVFLGIGSSVIPNVRIGSWSTVGAGGVVIDDLPQHSVAVGVPAKIKKNKA